mmetsp:Transcript_72406/g.162653  ORF Transcript_72406/g.162653 Transcript_72406/m.162653 type:complete len:244 (-) Transcript_72406:25-756(-)
MTGISISLSLLPTLGKICSQAKSTQPFEAKVTTTTCDNEYAFSRSSPARISHVAIFSLAAVGIRCRCKGTCQSKCKSSWTYVVGNKVSSQSKTTTVWSGFAKLNCESRRATAFGLSNELLVPSASDFIVQLRMSCTDLLRVKLLVAASALSPGSPPVPPSTLCSSFFWPPRLKGNRGWPSLLATPLRRPPGADDSCGVGCAAMGTGDDTDETAAPEPGKKTPQHPHKPAMGEASASTASTSYG